MECFTKTDQASHQRTVFPDQASHPNEQQIEFSSGKKSVTIQSLARVCNWTNNPNFYNQSFHHLISFLHLNNLKSLSLLSYRPELIHTLKNVLRLRRSLKPWLCWLDKVLMKRIVDHRILSSCSCFLSSRKSAMLSANTKTHGCYIVQISDRIYPLSMIGLLYISFMFRLRWISTRNNL